MPNARRNNKYFSPVNSYRTYLYKTVAHWSLKDMIKTKENIEPTTPEGYLIKGFFYIVVGLVGKLLSESTKDQTDSPLGDMMFFY